jgi:molybdopterin synthase catalytic subunit
MKVDLRYFGLLRDTCATSGFESIEIDDGASVRLLKEQLCEKYRSLAGLRRSISVAVNDEIVTDSHPLVDGDEVAFFPPVAGGAEGPYCRVVHVEPDLKEVLDAVVTPSHGGVVVFMGLVRDRNKGRAVTELQVDYHPRMVEKSLIDIVNRCEVASPGSRVAVSHRVGKISVGETVVIIAATSPERTAAFDAARMCIDLIKQETPIWKKEIGPHGVEWL